MELAPGRSLKSILAEKGQYGWTELKEIFLQILETVEVLHQNGIVHRDLKPANILVEGKQGIKILDFGLAKELLDTDKTSTVGEIVGSPFYISPEQIPRRSHRLPVRRLPASAILYRALAGCHPFEHTSTMEVTFKQLNQRPESLTAITGGLPRFLSFGLKRQWKNRRPGAAAMPVHGPFSP